MRAGRRAVRFTHPDKVLFPQATLLPSATSSPPATSSRVAPGDAPVREGPAADAAGLPLRHRTVGGHFMEEAPSHFPEPLIQTG